MNDELDNDFGLSDDDLLYRLMNPDDPWYMGPPEDDIYNDSDEYND